MNPEQARAILAAGQALRDAVRDKKAWSHQAKWVLDMIQSSMSVEHSSFLSILAALWVDATNPDILGEVYPSYAFLRAILETPVLDKVRWNEHNNPL
jgi:hypothetical protein